MAFNPLSLVPVVGALFGKKSVPRPPAWQDQLGQMYASIAQQYMPQVASQINALATQPLGSSLYMQQLRREIQRQAELGRRNLSYSLAARGIFAPPSIAGAQAAYEAYAARAGEKQINEALLQEEALKRQALEALANYVAGMGTGAGNLSAMITQQAMQAAQMSEAQENAWAQMLAPLFVELFRKKKTTTPAVNPLLGLTGLFDFTNLNPYKLSGGGQ